MTSRTLIVLGSVLYLSQIQAQGATIDRAALERVEQHFPNQLNALYQKHALKGDFLLAVIDTTGIKFSYRLNTHGANQQNGLSNDTPFLIASHSKALTGTLAQLLHSQGRFDLDAPLSKYLADTITDKRVASDAIRIKQLLNHTAGFTSAQHSFKTAYLGYQDEAELTSALNNNLLVATAGTFRYSNTGPILAAKAMEHATGKPWKTLMAEELFIPLGMRKSSSYVSDYPPGAILPSIAVDKYGNVTRQALFKTNSTMHAAGGVVSTLNDMAKWMQFNLLQSPQLSKDGTFFNQLHAATTPQVKDYFSYKRSGYSLGWDIATYHGTALLTRFGGYGGISFHASFMPQQQLAIVSFFNEERAHLLPHLAANYIYNLLISPEQAQQRFIAEGERLNQSLLREQQTANEMSDPIQISESNQVLLGNYIGEQGWPDVELFKNNSQLWLRWGQLDGPLYHGSDKDQFIAALGPLQRDIAISMTSDRIELKNGSIRYVKARCADNNNNGITLQACKTVFP